MTAIFGVCSAGAAGSAAATTSATPRTLLSAATGSEEQRQRREEAALEIAIRPICELVVELQDQIRDGAPRQPHQRAVEKEALTIVEALVPHDTVQMVDQRDDVLHVEAPLQLGPPAGLRSEGELTGEEIAERGHLQVGAGDGVPPSPFLGVEPGGVEANLDERRPRGVCDRDPSAGDEAVLLLLAPVQCQLFLCGAVPCGIEAPALPG